MRLALIDALMALYLSQQQQGSSVFYKATPIARKAATMIPRATCWSAPVLLPLLAGVGVGVRVGVAVFAFGFEIGAGVCGMSDGGVSLNPLGSTVDGRSSSSSLPSVEAEPSTPTVAVRGRARSGDSAVAGTGGAEVAAAAALVASVVVASGLKSSLHFIASSCVGVHALGTPGCDICDPSCPDDASVHLQHGSPSSSPFVAPSPSESS